MSLYLVCIYFYFFVSLHILFCNLSLLCQILGLHFFSSLTYDFRVFVEIHSVRLFWINLSVSSHDAGIFSLLYLLFMSFSFPILVCNPLNLRWQLKFLHCVCIRVYLAGSLFALSSCRDDIYFIFQQKQWLRHQNSAKKLTIFIHLSISMGSDSTFSSCSLRLNFSFHFTRYQEDVK